MRIFLLTIMLCVLANISYAIEIQDIRVGVHNDKIRIVLDLDQTSDFRTFVLSNPYRMVLDLPNFSWSQSKKDLPETSFINDIRKGGLNSEISRIVFDLNRPAIIQSAFMLRAEGSKKNRLVIDYVLTNEASFLAQKGNIHGTLKTEPKEKNPDKIQRSVNGVPIPPPNTKRPRNQQKPISKPAKKPLIVLDPGHGGVDPGAIGHGNIYEKDIVLSLSKELQKQLLSTKKYRVMLTRNKDIFIRLSDRVKFARKHEADLFISIHADSIRKRNIRGTSVYTLSQKASDAQTAKLAERENQADLIAGIDLNIEDKQVAFILGDFLMTDTVNQGNFFANTLVEKMQEHKIRTLERPHRYAGFAVLKAPDIPSVLIETGFISNKQEANMLRKPSHRKKIATAIKSGIETYFHRVRQNQQ